MSTRAKKEDQPATTERWVIDGLEQTPRGPVARIELPDGSTTDIPLHRLPADVQEGDILAIHDGPDGMSIERQPGETRQARKEAQSRLEALNAQGATPAGEEITV